MVMMYCKESSQNNDIRRVAMTTMVILILFQEPRNKTLRVFLQDQVIIMNKLILQCTLKCIEDILNGI